MSQNVGLFLNRRQVTTDIGDIAVATPSATDDADHVRIWTCPCTLDLKAAGRDAVAVSIGLTSELDRNRHFVLESWTSACFHDRLTTTLEITNEAIGIVAATSTTRPS